MERERTLLVQAVEQTAAHLAGTKHPQDARHYALLAEDIRHARAAKVESWLAMDAIKLALASYDHNVTLARRMGAEWVAKPIPEQRATTAAPPPIFDVDEFASRIRAKLERDGHSYRQAAPDVPISHATLQRVATGSPPDVENYLRLCRWLSTPNPSPTPINRRSE